MPGEISIPLPDGVRLHADEYGESDAPVTVLLLHGWTLDRQIWHRQVTGLTAAGLAVRIVAYDARGHGRSGPARRDTCTLAQLGDDLAEVVRAVARTGPVVLAGHSLGGMTIMEYAHRHPREFARRIAGLVLVSTTAEGAEHTSYGLPGRLAQLVRVAEVAGAQLLTGLGALTAASGTAGSGTTGTGTTGTGTAGFGTAGTCASSGWRPHQMILRPLRPGLRWLLFGDLADPADLRLAATCLADTSLGTIGGFRPSVGTQRRVPTLAGLPALPTAVLVGDRDRLTPPACAEAIAGVMPGAELTICPGGGHMLTLERPDEVTSALASVVSRASVTGVAAAG